MIVWSQVVDQERMLYVRMTREEASLVWHDLFPETVNVPGKLLAQKLAKFKKGLVV